jgi:MFS family permease
VVIAGSALLTLQNGLIISAFGAYLVAITGDTGWQAGAIAVGYAIVQMSNGLLAPITGWCCDRWGTRAVASVGTVTAAAGLALASRTGGATAFVGAVVVIALGCSAAGMTPLTIAVVQGGDNRRTLALGLLNCGIALGGLLVPSVVWMLGAIGWRGTFLVVAGTTLVFGLLTASALPARRARAPDRPVRSEPRTQRGHDLRGALRSSAFWLLVAGHGTALVAVSAVNLHLVPLLTSHAFSLGAAGAAMAAMSVAQLAGQIVTSVIGDRSDKRRLAVGCMAAHTAALVTFAAASGFALLTAAAVVHGLAWGLRGPLMNALRADYFGIDSFATIVGWSMGFVSLGMMTGPVLVSALAGGPGGYGAAFAAVAVITGLGCVAFLVLRPPRLSADRARRGAGARRPTLHASSRRRSPSGDTSSRSPGQ